MLRLIARKLFVKRKRTRRTPADASKRRRGPLERAPPGGGSGSPVLLGQREAEAVEGGVVEGAHAVAGGGLGQLSGDARGERIRRGGDGHACLAGGVAVAEQAPDGEGEAEVLDVHEKRSAVGGEGWAGEVRVVLNVAGEPVDVAFKGSAGWLIGVGSGPWDPQTPWLPGCARRWLGRRPRGRSRT